MSINQSKVVKGCSRLQSFALNHFWSHCTSVNWSNMLHNTCFNDLLQHFPNIPRLGDSTDFLSGICLRGCLHVHYFPVYEPCPVVDYIPDVEFTQSMKSMIMTESRFWIICLQVCLEFSLHRPQWHCLESWVRCLHGTLPWCRRRGPGSISRSL